MQTERAGWLRKNHKSAAYSAGSAKRFFKTTGFQTFYYENETTSSAKGHFDLRNCLGISTVPEAEAPDAVEVLIGEGKKADLKKRLVVSFEMDPSQKAAWLQLWCSAIAAQHVAEDLKQYVDVGLSRKLNLQFSLQTTVGSRRSLLGGAPSTKALTPRSSADDVGMPTTPTKPSADDEPAEEEDFTTFEVSVPPNAKAGDKLRMVTPSGTTVYLAIPDGAGPGAILTFELPSGPSEDEKAATVIQARVRGAMARKASAKLVQDGEGEGEAPAGMSDEEAAAKIQATLKGKNSRHVMKIEADAAVLIQSHIRGSISRAEAKEAGGAAEPDEAASASREPPAPPAPPAPMLGEKKKSKSIVGAIFSSFSSKSGATSPKQTKAQKAEAAAEEAEAEAATKVQAVMRGKEARASTIALKVETVAAVKVQAVHRGNAARKAMAKDGEGCIIC